MLIPFFARLQIGIVLANQSVPLKKPYSPFPSCKRHAYTCIVLANNTSTWRHRLPFPGHANALAYMYCFSESQKCASELSLQIHWPYRSVVVSLPGMEGR